MRRAERGFTLVEVLTALVVTALLLAVVLDASTAALTRLHATGDRRTALLYGRYLLVRGAVLDYGGGNGAGTLGRFAWTSDERLVATDAARVSALMRVHVRVAAADGRALFDRATLRLKALPRR